MEFVNPVVSGSDFFVTARIKSINGNYSQGNINARFNFNNAGMSLTSSTTLAATIVESYINVNYPGKYTTLTVTKLGTPSYGSINVNLSTPGDLNAALVTPAGIDLVRIKFTNIVQGQSSNLIWRILQTTPAATSGGAPTLSASTTCLIKNNGSPSVVMLTDAGAACNTNLDHPFTSAPPNDGCANAATLNGSTAGTPTLSPVAGTTVGATNVGGLAGQCGNPDDEVWYVLSTDDSGGNLTFNVTPSGTFDPSMELYTGTCTSLTYITCTTENSLTYAAASSTTYYLRIYDAGTGYTGGGVDERAAGSFSVAASGSALPIELKSFNARINGASNLIEWATATERNVQSHIVERSIDGINNWTEIGRVAAAGNTTKETRYALKDNAPALKSFYRLRSVDFDTKESISSIVVVSRKNEAISFTSVFPVPTTDYVNINFTSEENAEISLQVTDVAGRLVRTIAYTATKGDNAYRLDMDDMAAGMYLVVLNNGISKSEAVRLVKN
jgi:Secretion system C-terminal sorting domain